jgi:hypothetical protein
VPNSSSRLSEGSDRLVSAFLPDRAPEIKKAAPGDGLVFYIRVLALPVNANMARRAA